jgi:predicted metal-dependent hydrolase
MTHTRELILDGVCIELVRKRIKHVYVRVLPPLGQACISAPLRMSDAAVREFALSKLDWIRSHQKRLRATVPQPPCNFAEGEEIAVWGRPRRIRFFPVGGTRRIFLRGDWIDLHAPASDGPELRKQLFERLLHRELEREIPRLLALWCPRLAVPMPAFSIRPMRTRWGSCSPAAGRVRFALHLAEKPAHFLEYVVVHELAHLLERGHGEAFTACLDKFLPHWRRVRSEMRASA